jgi:C4-dicarboxylate transporter
LIGVAAIFSISTIQLNASMIATDAPVIAAVRVPPSATRTSQSSFTVNSPNLKSSSIARTLRPISRWIS